MKWLLCHNPKLFENWADTSLNIFLLKTWMDRFLMELFCVRSWALFYLNPIVKQVWLLSLINCLYRLGISLMQQLTTWAITSLHNLLLKRSIELLFHGSRVVGLFLLHKYEIKIDLPVEKDQNRFEPETRRERASRLGKNRSFCVTSTLRKIFDSSEKN